MARSTKRLSALLLALSCCSAAFAGDRGDWFKSLKMPGTKASCCGLGDCHRTDAEWRKGGWWAVVDNKWRPVPQSKVLASPSSIDGSAYVCTGAMGSSPPTVQLGEPPIYCFVPPNWPA